MAFNSVVPQAHKTIYFVRHGQSIHNKKPVFQSNDAPLSEAGQKQAKDIAERATHLDFEAIISSPFPRAAETAQAIADKTQKPLEFSDLFTERIKPTSIDGKAWTDEAANKVWRAWEESLYDGNLRVEDGENYTDMVERADRALDYLFKRPEKSLVVVSHGHFLRTIISRVLLGERLDGASLQQIQKVASMENTGLTVLQYKDVFEDEPCWQLWTYNDHAHFAE